MGFVLALVGLVLTQLPSLLSYYLLSSGMTIVEYSQMVGALATAGYLLSGVGLFLLLRELGSRLPAPPAYLRFTPLVVLVGTLFLVGIGLVYLWLLPALYGGSSLPPISVDMFTALNLTDWVAEAAIGVSVLLSVLGAVRALESRRAPPVLPPPQ